MAVVACRTREAMCTQLKGKSYRGTEAESHDGIEVSRLKEKELGEGWGRRRTRVRWWTWNSRRGCELASGEGGETWQLISVIRLSRMGFPHLSSQICCLVHVSCESCLSGCSVNSCSPCPSPTTVACTSVINTRLLESQGPDVTIFLFGA